MSRHSAPDCYDYIRRNYQVPAYIGVRVRVGHTKRLGVLVNARTHLHYLHVRFDDQNFSVNAHPTDEVEYLVVERAV